MANQELKKKEKEAIKTSCVTHLQKINNVLKITVSLMAQLKNARDLQQMSAIDKSNKYLPKNLLLKLIRLRTS